MIEIPEYDPEPIQPTEQEIYQAETLLNHAELFDRLNTVEMGNAAILLMLAERKVENV